MWSEFIGALSLLFGRDDALRDIIWTTLRMSILSTLISSLIGLPLGAVIGAGGFRGKRLVMRVVNTLMGLPPVVGGLVVFLILSRSGPLGTLKLLYTVTAMVIAQVVLITPIVTGMTAAVVESRAGALRETCDGVGISRARQLLYLLYESRTGLVTVVLSGFGRAIAEVGAVQIVGGNVQGKTRVMTTAIMMETNMGHFDYAICLGVVLLIIAFAVNSAARAIGDRGSERSGGKA